MDSFVNESSNEQEGRQNNEYQNEEIRFLIPSHRDQCNIENDRADDGDMTEKQQLVVGDNYAIVVLLTVGIHAAAAVTVSGQAGGGYLLSAAGAILFYLSDATLLARKYGAIRGKYVTALIWLTYVPAQLCLMTGIYLMRNAPV